MWTKDVYQEQMLGYLGEVKADIEQLACYGLRQRDLNELYIDMNITFGELWQLIEASDVDWEGCRYPVETSCDQLQRALSDDAMLSASLIMTEDRKTLFEVWETAEMPG